MGDPLRGNYPLDIAALPDIETFRRLTQSLAMLDAVLSPDWEMRYYSFNARWAEGEMMASMRNGSGDAWFLWFGPAGAFLKGFAHESPMAEGPTGEGVFSEVPNGFCVFLTDPAFSLEDTTFCIWCTWDDNQWQKGIDYAPGSDPDGSADLLSILDGRPSTYQAWAQNYYEMKIRLAAVKHVYLHQSLTTQIIAQLNPEVALEDLSEDLAEIGYPIA